MKLNRLFFSFAAAIIAMLFTDVAMAKSLGVVADGMTGQFAQVGKLAGAIGYTAGIVIGVIAAFQFKAHKDNPQGTPLSKPIVYLVVAMMLIFLPSVFETARDTTFGQDAVSQGSNGSGMNF